MASMTSRLYAFLGLVLLLQQGWIHCSEESPLQKVDLTASASQAGGKGWATVHRRLGAFQSCQATDISVAQGQISGDKIPRFEVQITNTCILD
jgi:hypothetical protein